MTVWLPTQLVVCQFLLFMALVLSLSHPLPPCHGHCPSLPATGIALPSLPWALPLDLRLELRGIWLVSQPLGGGPCGLLREREREREKTERRDSGRVSV